MKVVVKVVSSAWVLLTVLVVLSVVTGCGGTSTPPPEAQSVAEELTSTPTVTPTPTDTPTLTPTPTNTLMPLDKIRATVVVSQVKLREGPDAEYDVVTNAREGDVLIVTGRDEAGEWFEVTPDGERVAWVAALAVELNVSDTSMIPLSGVTPTPTPTTVPIEDAVAEVKAEAANVRVGPGGDYETIWVVYKGETYKAVERNSSGEWIRLLLEDEKELFGWVAESVVEVNVDVKRLPVAEGLPTPQPAAEVTPEPEYEMPECSRVPIRGFGSVWGNNPRVASTLGCPRGDEEGHEAAVQNFQHGVMILMADTTFVLFDDGSIQYFSSMGAAEASAVKGTAPSGLHDPGDKFSKVYWEGTGARVSDRIGWGTSPQQDSPGAYQRFSDGYMLWVEATDRIYVAYNYYDYSIDDYVRTWESFEDVF